VAVANGLYPNLSTQRWEHSNAKQARAELIGVFSHEKESDRPAKCAADEHEVSNLCSEIGGLTTHKETYMSSTKLPNDVHVNYVASGQNNTDLASDGKPYPPDFFAVRTSMLSGRAFYEQGITLKQDILRALPTGFSFAGKRILDFGCGSGRVLRHFAEEASQCEFWGCDIHMPSILWLTEHFSPPFLFFNNSEHAHLPFESNSFDLIIAVSVFTHLTENWNQWLMELWRILRPSGYAYITFHHSRPYEMGFKEAFDEERIGMLVRNFDRSWDNAGPAVYHSTWWIKQYWGHIFEIEYIALNAVAGFQSLALMRKPSDKRPLQSLPVLVFDANAHSSPVPHALAEVYETYRSNCKQLSMTSPSGDGLGGGSDQAVGDYQVDFALAQIATANLNDVEVLSDGSLSAKTAKDPQIHLLVHDLYAEDYRQIVISMSATEDIGTHQRILQFFYVVKDEANPTAELQFSVERSFRLQLRPDANMHSYSIDTAHLANWKGFIAILRLDPVIEGSSTGESRIVIKELRLVRGATPGTFVED